MNAKTAKLCRRVARATGNPYRRIKALWKSCLKHLRKAMRDVMRLEIIPQHRP